MATGGGLGFELALAAPGIVPGVAAGMIFRVFRGADRFPRRQAGIACTALWIVVADAPIGVSYATSHSRHLQAWQFTHYFTADAITDALIFMAARRQRRTGPGRAVMNRCSVIQKRKKLQDPLRGGLHTSRGLPGPGFRRYGLPG